MSAGQFTYFSVNQATTGTTSFVPATGTEWILLSVSGYVDVATNNSVDISYYNVSGAFNAYLLFLAAGTQSFSFTTIKSFFDDNINLNVSVNGPASSTYINAFASLIQVL